MLGRGDFVGEIALLEGTPRTASVTAVTPALVFVANPREFAVLMSVPSVAARRPPRRRRPAWRPTAWPSRPERSARTRYPAEARRGRSPGGARCWSEPS